jgi:hypothetical protein
LCIPLGEMCRRRDFQRVHTAYPHGKLLEVAKRRRRSRSSGERMKHRMYTSGRIRRWLACGAFAIVVLLMACPSPLFAYPIETFFCEDYFLFWTHAVPSQYGPFVGSISTDLNPDGTVTSSQPLVFSGGGLMTGKVSLTVPFDGLSASQILIALKLDSNGVPIPGNSPVISTIVNDMNASTAAGALIPTNTSSIASPITGAYTSLFPADDNWDIMISCLNPINGGPFGFDFSQDKDPSTPNLTATEVSGVPEPSSAMLFLLAAVGFGLRGRMQRGRRAEKIKEMNATADAAGPTQ